MPSHVLRVFCVIAVLAMYASVALADKLEQDVWQSPAAWGNPAPSIDARRRSDPQFAPSAPPAHLANEKIIYAQPRTLDERTGPCAYHSAPNFYANCQSAGLTTAVTNAWTAAINLIDSTLARLPPSASVMPCDNSFQEYFGGGIGYAVNSASKSYVIARLNDARLRLCNPTPANAVRYWCEVSGSQPVRCGGIVAQAAADGSNIIRLCKPFFDNSPTVLGFSTQASILLHESTHTITNAATRTYDMGDTSQYPPTGPFYVDIYGAEWVALLDSSRALRHADSYEYFALSLPSYSYCQYNPFKFEFTAYFTSSPAGAVSDALCTSGSSCTLRVLVDGILPFSAHPPRISVRNNGGSPSGCLASGVLASFSCTATPGDPNGVIVFRTSWNVVIRNPSTGAVTRSTNYQTETYKSTGSCSVWNSAGTSSKFSLTVDGTASVQASSTFLGFSIGAATTAAQCAPPKASR